jgi:hypothetical protein
VQGVANSEFCGLELAVLLRVAAKNEAFIERNGFEGELMPMARHGF